MALTKVTGQVIKNTTDVTVGVLTVTNTLAVGGTVSIGGTLTYEDVTNVDAVGLITARNGIVVGSGITLSKDGDVFATGVTTTGSLVSSGAISGTTGTFTGNVDIAANIRHIDDTDTYISFPANNEIEMYVASQQAIKFTTTSIETGDNKRIDIIDAAGDRSGEIKNSDSTANSLMISADPDNSGSSSVMQFSVDGSEKLRINSNGQLLVGTTTTPASTNTKFRLHLPINSSSANAFEISHNTNGANKAGAALGLAIANGGASTNAADLFFQIATGGSLAERLRITSTGDMGLGTNSPNSLLHITKSASTAYDASQTDAQRGSTATLNITNDDTTNNSFAQIAFRNDGTNQSIARIVAIKRSTNSSHLAFVTEHGATPAERMRITSDGFIGVGGGTPASSPRGQFVINSEKNANSGTTNPMDPAAYHLVLKNDNDTNNEAIGLCFSASSTVDRVGAAIIHQRDSAGSVGSLKFFTSPSEGTTTERLRITSGGEVGINNSSPDNLFKLDVNGGVRIGNNVDGVIIENAGSNADVDNAACIRRHASTGNLHITAGTSIARNLIFGTKTSGGEIARFTDTGLCFNGDTAAANALDDYEEGNWTPAVKNGGGTITTIHSAKYTKVGRLVHIQTYFSYTTANNSGSFQIQGLPFNNTSEAYSAQVVDFGRGGKKGAYSRIHPNSAYSEFLYSSENTGADRITIKGNNIGSGYIIFSNTYQST